MAIIKAKVIRKLRTRQQAYGDKHEKDVAFYLRRAFKDDDRYHVFNDLRIVFDGEVAQIDHLILHKKGFVLIESKSIYGEVKVNKRGEWQRSHNGHWKGMASPIRQVELQKHLLQNLLYANDSKLLGKFLGLQQGFGGRLWSLACAVSNNCVLHRDEIPMQISDKVVKAENIEYIVRALAQESLSLRDLIKSSQPSFTDVELENICNFLLESHVDCSQLHSNLPTDEQEIQSCLNGKLDNLPTCKHCGASGDLLKEKRGRYGPYYQCDSCSKNTSLKHAFN
ncbi:nuclease-related domain-containing protein [Neptuniibacter sp. QD37_11]|uniref:nuclease-related domain-containing protein n=1 Tax=Neptuniibacter sp. QD37_11 TaxID=3398209 RepID=UPI0039F4492B